MPRIRITYAVKYGGVDVVESGRVLLGANPDIGHALHGGIVLGIYNLEIWRAKLHVGPTCGNIDIVVPVDLYFIRVWGEFPEIVASILTIMMSSVAGLRFTLNSYS